MLKKVFFLFLALLFLGVTFRLLIPSTQHAAATQSTLDSMVLQTMNDIDKNGWNAAVKGTFINWYITNPATQQNTGHDSQNDLRDYEAMVWYKALHPTDTSQDQYIQRILPTVQAEWGNSNLSKGWVYAIFLRLAKYAGSSWNTTAQNWAASNYTKVTAANGVPLGPIVEDTGANAPTCPSGYRIDQNLETGLMLIDAGKRFNHPEWAQAGAKEVSQIDQQAFNQSVHLYARIMCQGKVWDNIAKDGEMGQEAQAYLDAGSYTGNQAYLAKGEEMLDAIANPATGFIDNTNGGIWFQKDLGTGVVDTGKKVMQQFAVLQAFYTGDLLFNNRYSAATNNMITAIQKSFVPGSVPGWMYERAPDFTQYKTENWISVEASGMAIEAILTMESNSSLPTSPLPSTTPLPTSGGTLPAGSTPVSISVGLQDIGNGGDISTGSTTGGN
ncbi:MAG TPA: hypothetical protein VGT05_05360, partial [Patescibacteria group bacterium]|nr:hypothetical protein [Patescibacteria group bacterium]